MLQFAEQLKRLSLHCRDIELVTFFNIDPSEKPEAKLLYAQKASAEMLGVRDLCRQIKD